MRIEKIIPILLTRQKAKILLTAGVTEHAEVPPFTEKMAYRLKAMAQYPKHHCFRCNQRNDIENVFFCLSCGEIRCWQCIHQHEKKIDPNDGKMHHVCRCGNYLKLWDEWYEQVKVSFPDVF